MIGEAELSVAVASGPTERRSGCASAVANRLAPRRIGAVYVLLLIVVVFGALEPHTFLTAQTGKTILNQYAVTGLLALSLVVPLAAGVFDLSVGAQAGVASVLVATLVVHHRFPIPAAVVLVIVAGQVVGLVNAFVVVVLKVDSFIGTLGTGAILGAIAIGISGNQTITGARISGAFERNIALRNLWGGNHPRGLPAGRDGINWLRP